MKLHDCRASPRSIEGDRAGAPPARKHAEKHECTPGGLALGWKLETTPVVQASARFQPGLGLAKKGDHGMGN